MTCVCGHSDDLYVIKIKGAVDLLVIGQCVVCLCNEFTEDIDRDELEVE